MRNKFIKIIELYKHSSEKGLVLLVSALLAIIIANSPLKAAYFSILTINFMGMSFSHVVNDVLMSLFFLLVGLEIKKEIFEGHLSDKAKVTLPILAACCGVLLPVIIYVLINFNNKEALMGWAIPAATDIAFALSAYAILCNHLSRSMRVLLTAIAIIDDIIAVSIIAIFYSTNLNYWFLMAILFAAVLSYLILKRSRQPIWCYFLLWAGFIMLFFKSGVHSSVAGVLVAFLIPFNQRNKNNFNKLENILAPYVQYIIIPLFALTNSGVTISLQSLINPSSISLGIMAGLVFGKMLGIYGAWYIGNKLGLLRSSTNIACHEILSISALCGIGFTMSIFIADLSFPNNTLMLNDAKIGIIAGSIISAIIALLITKLSKIYNVNKTRI